MMKIKSNVIILAILLIFTVIPSAFAENYQKIGATDCGELYLVTDSVTTVKRGGEYFLAAMYEERYTDPQFLAELRKSPALKDAVSALVMYLFDNNGSRYYIAANYIIDASGKVCLDMGSDMTSHIIGQTDKTMENAYTAALKIIENKNKLTRGR